MLTTVNIILAVIAIIVFFVALKTLKSIFTAIASVMGFLVICLLAFSVIIYLDAGQLQDSFSEDKLILFEHTNEIRSGILITGGSSEALISQDSEITHLTQTTLQNYTQTIEEGEIDSLPYGLILTIDAESFEKNFTLAMGERDINMTEDVYNNIFLAQSIDDIDAILFEEYGNVGSLVIYEDATEIKSIIASNAFIEDAASTGSNYLLNLVREGDLELHPDFLTQTILKSIPSFMLPE